jgi:hypothetical protein
MTDDRRIDLSAAAPTSDEADRVISAVMTRLPGRSAMVRPPTAVDLLAARSMRWVTAAAIMLAIASLMVSRKDAASERQAVDLIAQWAAGAQVPTNADLLATFQGYQR